jgi:DNA-binding transcriptional MerR regulator
MAARTQTRRTSAALVARAPSDPRRRLVAIDVLAAATGLHPQHLRRLVALGVVQPRGGTRDAPLFTRDAAARLARIGRVRRDLGLNYAGAVLACDLLDRIDDLEARLRRYESPR